MKQLCYFVLSVLLIFVLLAGCKPDSNSSQVVTEVARSDSTPPPTQVEPTAIPTQAKSSSSWQVIHQTEAQHSTTIIGFLGERLGITAGAGGEMHYTTDGGETWPEADNDSLCRFGLEILDEQVAWHCGNGGHIRLTTDGGKTWHPVADFGPNEPKHCRFLSFIDADIGWAATPFQLSATKNSGTTWTEINLPQDIDNIAAISLLTSKDGYLLDTKANVYITQDSGKTWITRSLGLEAGRELMDFNAPMAAMRWFDADHGLVVLSLVGKGENQVIALYTDNGGHTWEQEKLPSKFGALFLSRDGKYLTITHLGNKISVLRYEGL